MIEQITSCVIVLFYIDILLFHKRYDRLFHCSFMSQFLFFASVLHKTELYVTAEHLLCRFLSTFFVF